MMPYDSSFDAMDHDFERLEEFDDLNLDMKSQAPTEGHDEFRKFDFDSNQYHQRGPSDRPILPPLDHRAYSYSPPSSQPQLATSANPFDEMSWDTTSITFAAHESRQNSEVSKPSERYNNFQATQKSNTPAPINSGTSYYGPGKNFYRVQGSLEAPSQQPEDAYAGAQSGRSGIEQHYSYEEGQLQTDTDPFTESARHGHNDSDAPSLAQGTYVPAGASSAASSRHNAHSQQSNHSTNANLGPPNSEAQEGSYRPPSAMSHQERTTSAPLSIPQQPPIHQRPTPQQQQQAQQQPAQQAQQQ
jgi:hypothetical protein